MLWMDYQKLQNSQTVPINIQIRLFAHFSLEEFLHCENSQTKETSKKIGKVFQQTAMVLNKQNLSDSSYFQMPFYKEKQ